MQSLTYGLKPVPFKDRSARAYFNRLLDDPAAADDFVAIVEDSGLAWGYGALRFVRKLSVLSATSVPFGLHCG